MRPETLDVKVTIEIGPGLYQLLQIALTQLRPISQALVNNREEAARPQQVVQVDPNIVLGVIERFLSRSLEDDRHDEERRSKY